MFQECSPELVKSSQQAQHMVLKILQIPSVSKGSLSLSYNKFLNKIKQAV